MGESLGDRNLSCPTKSAVIGEGSACSSCASSFASSQTRGLSFTQEKILGRVCGADVDGVVWIARLFEHHLSLAHRHPEELAEDDPSDEGGEDCGRVDVQDPLVKVLFDESEGDLGEQRGERPKHVDPSQELKHIVHLVSCPWIKQQNDVIE